MRALLVAGPLCVTLAGPALADPPPTPVGEIVVTATRLPAELTDAPDAHVVEAAEIELRQASFAADVLRLVPGLAVGDNGAFGGATGVRIRGASADETLVVIDGVVQNDASQPSGGYDFGGLDLADIARIEVLSGPQGSLWGSDAIGGVIALTTREESGERAALEGGSLSTVRASAGFGVSRPDWALGASASGFSTGGVSKADGFPERDPFYEWTAGVAGRLALTPTISLDGRVRYENSHVDIDGYPPPNFTFGDDGEYATSRSWTGSVRARLAGPWGFAQILTVDGYDLNRASLGGAFPSGYRADRGDVRWMVERGAPGDPFGLALGVERDATRATLSDGSDANLGDTSAFAVVRDRPVRPLTLTASLRYDAPDGFAGRATARTGTVLDLGAGFAFTGDWGQGFKTPTISQIACDFCFPPGRSVGLRPETAEGWDLGLRQRTADGRFEASVSYFRLAVRDQIAFGTGRYVNIDRNLSTGVEADAKARLTGALTLEASYVHTDAIDRSTGLELPRVPKDAGSLSLLWAGGRLSGALTVRAESAQADVDPNTFLPATRPDFVLADIAAGYRLSPHLELTARVTNITDRHYQETLGYGEPRRMVLVGVRVRK
ncbi:MAG: TonB-dependent receptor [Pseudomonadota bacterium]|nr:TonB-dependent receptor [Pseudomonadota bacterium]